MSIRTWCSDPREVTIVGIPVDYMLEGRLPGALISGHDLYHTADGNYIKLPGILTIPLRIPTAPTPDLSKGKCPPGTYLDQTFGIYTCGSIHRAQELHPNVKLLNNQWQRAW